MAQNDDELQYEDLIKNLKGIKKIDAPEYFETDLMRKINSGKFGLETSSWKKFLHPSRLIPSAALVVTTIVFLFTAKIYNGNGENPLMIAPQARNDVTAYSTADNRIQSNDLRKSRSAESPDTDASMNSVDRNYSAANANFIIPKSGLNFRMVNIVPSERLKVKELKAKMYMLMHTKVPN